MPDPVAAPETSTAPAENGIDINAVSDEIFDSLGFGKSEADNDTDADAATEPSTQARKAPQSDTPVAAPAANTEQVAKILDPASPQPKQPPKSWAKETHELWGKIDPKVQEYVEKREKDFLDGLDQYKGDAGFAKEMRDVMTPYKPILAAQGVSETQAVQFLLNAHYQLSQGSPESRMAAYQTLGKNLGLIKSDETGEPVAVDPAVQQLQEEVRSVKSALTAREQAAFEEVRTRTAKEVETFATDVAHPYFDEVAAETAAFIKSGDTLEAAYEKAVWANPVTRAKEQARVSTELEAKLKENARLDALKARKASETNVRGRDSQKAPTEPVGKMFEDMGDILKDIRTRSTH